MALAFTKEQMESLKLLFTLSNKQRRAILGMESEHSDHSSNSESPASSRQDDDEDSDRGSDDTTNSKKRVHVKTKIGTLATEIVQVYLKSKKIFDYLYGSGTRVREDRLDTILSKIKPDLSQKERHLLRKNYRNIKRAIKKKLSSAKNYRGKALKNKKGWAEAPQAEAIDLTMCATQSDEDVTPTPSVGKVKEESCDEESTPGEALSPVAKKKPDPKCKKQLAQQFVSKMQDRRKGKKGTPRRKKQVARKALQAALKRKASTMKTDTPAKKRKETANEENAAASPPHVSDKETANEENVTASPPHVSDKDASPLTFQVGSRISGMWKGPECRGDWYDGVVKKINTKKQTAHVVYDDGDEDTTLEWADMRILY